eukprot:4718548-Pleurochrysis_carterae.AAC.1
MTLRGARARTAYYAKSARLATSTVTLPAAEQQAAVMAAMKMRKSAREEARADLAEQQAYFKTKREQASKRQLAKLVSEYTKALA